MALEIEKLTLGELAFMEDYVGTSFQNFQGEDTSQAKVMIAMCVVALKRDGHPHATSKEAEKLGIEKAMEILGMDEEAEDVESEDPKDED